MAREHDWLDDLADAVGAGRTVDWAAARARAADGGERAILQHLESISWVQRAFSELAAQEPESAPSSSRAHPPRVEREAGPPALVGGYAIRRFLGEGPLGFVYLAERAGIDGPPAALKLIRWRLDSARILERFEAVRAALGRFAGSEIVPTVDAGESDEGRVYFVHEFVDGPSILEHCRGLGPGLRHRLELFAATCDLVQTIHDAGMRHGTLKPGNVLVAPGPRDSSPRLLDLGVAEALDQRATERALFRDHGRPSRDLCYYSPEETGGGSAPPDTRSDLYSLGVLLYELIAGEAPFAPRIAPRAEVAEVLRRIREDPPVAPRGRRPAALVPARAAALDRIVLRALEKERSRRHPSAAELAADVRRFLEMLSEGQ